MAHFHLFIQTKVSQRAVLNTCLMNLSPTLGPWNSQAYMTLVLWIQFPWEKKEKKKRQEAINSIAEMSHRDAGFVAGGDPVARLLKSNSHNSLARRRTAESLPVLHCLPHQRMHNVLCHQ